MDFIKGWILTMVVTAFIVTIVDMILPSGKLKPHVNVVLNFIFLFVVISPIVELIKTDMKVGDVLLKEYNKFEHEYARQMESFENNNYSGQVQKNYKEGLKDNLNVKLKEYGYEIKNLEIENNDIKNIQIAKEKNGNNVLKGEIQLSEEEKYTQTFKNEVSINENELKEDISKIFNVSIEKIQIN